MHNDLWETVFIELFFWFHIQEREIVKILVTGGSGNIGRFVIAELKKHGHAVRAFDVKEGDGAVEDFVKGSITEPAEIEGAMEGIDGVVHLAAIPSLQPQIPTVEYMNVNVTGTFNVLEAAAKNSVSKVAIASSDSSLGFVFGTHRFAPEYFPIDECHILQPQDPYGLSKLMGEELCKRATRRYGVKTICLRFCWVWFPQTYDHRPSIVAEEIELNAKRMWGYADVRDVAQACRLSMEAENIEHEAFFISAEDTFADETTIELIKSGYPEVRQISNDYLTDVHKSIYDISKARKLLGYEPKYKWREVLECV